DEETIESKEPNTPAKQPKNNEKKEKSQLFVDEVVKEYKPKISYPQKLIQNEVKEQYGQFLKILKQLHINISFVDALLNMPRYVKHLKEIISNKRKLEDLAIVTLNEECSAILQHKLPPKLKDPGSFTIPCTIGGLSIDNALADLGADINLIPYFMFKKLGLGELRPTRMTI